LRKRLRKRKRLRRRKRRRYLRLVHWSGN